MTAGLIDPRELHSGEYVERFETQPMSRISRLVDLMEIKSTDRLVDFGCGNGMLLKACGRRIAEYVGVDFSEDFIGAAKRRAQTTGLRNYRFECAEISEFCARELQAFDIAATLDLCEHVDDSMFVEIYAAIRGSLRPGGRLYVHTPNLEFVVERMKQIGVMQQFPEHIAVRTADELARLLIRCGFPPGGLRISILPHYNVLRYMHPLHAIPGIGHMFGARLWIECVV